jgi:hypothetical protein
MISSVTSTIGGVLQTAKDIYTTVTSIPDYIQQEVKSLTDSFQDNLESLTSDIQNALPDDVLAYITDKEDTSSNTYTEVKNSLNYTTLSADLLPYILDHYAQRYPAIATGTGNPLTTDSSNVTYKHLQSLFNLLKTTGCPNLQYPDLVNQNVQKSIYDLAVIDLAIKGVPELLKLLLQCGLHNDERTKLILKDLVYDVAKRGDVYTLSVILDVIDVNLIPSPIDLLKTICLNAELSSETAKTALDNVYDKLSLTIKDVMQTHPEYNKINQTNDQIKEIYDLNNIAALKITNPDIMYQALSVDDCNMFIKVFDLYRI